MKNLCKPLNSRYLGRVAAPGREKRSGPPRHTSGPRQLSLGFQRLECTLVELNQFALSLFFELDLRQRIWALPGMAVPN